MTILAQLEDTVTTALLARINQENSIAYISLLEIFYALLIVRLLSSDIDMKALPAEKLMAEVQIGQLNSAHPLFECLWPLSSQRRLMVAELAATYHIDERQVTDLLIWAAPLAYRELRVLSEGKFLPVFLQQQQAVVRPYLPVWAESVVATESAALMSSQDDKLNPDQLIEQTQDTAVINRLENEQVSTNKDSSTYESITKPELSAVELDPASMANDAFYDNPSNRQYSKHTPLTHKNRRLGIKALVVFSTLMAIAGLWVLFIQPNSIIVNEAVVAESTTTSAADVLTPIQLLVGVDDSGSLYTCSASVGGAHLQSELMQALTTSFGAQASICELTIKSGVAEHLDDLRIDINTLSKIFDLLKSVPFSRLQLHDNSLELQAPDEAMLTNLLMEMRAVSPTLTITVESSSLSSTNKTGDNYENDTIDNSTEDNNTEDNSSDNELGGSEGSSFRANTDISPNLDYQPADEDDLTGNNIEPAPFTSGNSQRSRNLNNQPTNAISRSEVEDLAGTIIVAEQLSNESRVE